MNRPLAILLAVFMTLGLSLPGGAQGRVVCFGGGRLHEAGVVDRVGFEHCSRVLGINSYGPEHHDEHCRCTDVTAAGVAIAPTNRLDDSLADAELILSSVAWFTLVDGYDHQPTGPPRAPPWFDPGRKHRLSIIASTRLII